MQLRSGLLWLWCRLAAAALSQLLAWELLYATSVALKKSKYRFGGSTLDLNQWDPGIFFFFNKSPGEWGVETDSLLWV